MSATSVGALILAGGKGTRMYSEVPKVLKKILEEPMLRYVYDAVVPVCGEKIFTVVGHHAAMVTATFPGMKTVLQEQQLGTGHALQIAWSALEESAITHVLVVNGDTPLLEQDVLENFLHDCLKKGDGPAVAFVSLTLDDPAAFGRVVRKNGSVAAIVEAKDYLPEEHGHDPHEINAGIYCLEMKALKHLLPLLQNNNKSGEYYITDLVSLALEHGYLAEGYSLGHDTRLLGVNNPVELVRSEEELRAAIIERHLKNGVLIHQKDQVRIGPAVQIERGAEITGPCELYGATTVGGSVCIDSHCKIVDSAINSGVHIQSYSFIVESVVGANATVGPFARLRPGAVLSDKVHIGNFVEVKKSVLATGAKVNHLTYIGDAEIGAHTNIGAGTITCNYDGVHKHKTTIGSNAFIGSNTSLVAPVSVGDGALVGAGSVITTDVPAGELAIARGRQVNLAKRKK